MQIQQTYSLMPQPKPVFDARRRAMVQ